MSQVVEMKYPSGKIKCRWNLVNGKLSGRSETFSERGELLSESNFEDGMADGECKRYYRNGQLKELERWVGGKYHGEQESYFTSGKIKGSFPYSEGKLNGEVKIYHENGKLAKQAPYKDGRKEGKAFEWDENGVLTGCRCYREGEMTQEFDYFANGMKSCEKIVHADTGLHDLYEWHQNGQMKKKGIHEGAIYHVWKWDEEGKQIYEGVGHWDKDESIAHLTEV